MVSFAKRLFGDNGNTKKAFDHKAAADAFVRQFDELWQKCLEHASETETLDAVHSIESAMNAIASRLNAGAQLADAFGGESCQANE